MKEKSGLSSSLENLDEGNLTFPREELIHFLRSDELVFCFVLLFFLRQRSSSSMHSIVPFTCFTSVTRLNTICT